MDFVDDYGPVAPLAEGYGPWSFNAVGKMIVGLFGGIALLWLPPSTLRTVCVSTIIRIYAGLVWTGLNGARVVRKVDRPDWYLTERQPTVEDEEATEAEAASALLMTK
ncbi:hypothetical protein BJY52DRAFT_1229050 [Lactarius psammicola]|nr:hypothetical protein BJY52DRAFT_1229050 [Lactarius psammicola]